MKARAFDMDDGALSPDTKSRTEGKQMLFLM
jgi:hypothetical protein